MHFQIYTTIIKESLTNTYVSYTNTKLTNCFQNTSKSYQINWYSPFKFHNLNYIFHYCQQHRTQNNFNFSTSHTFLVVPSENGKICNRTLDMRTCWRARILRLRQENVSLDLGQYSNLHLNFQMPPLPPNYQNVTVMQQTSLWQVHILYRQKQILKCTTTELPLEQTLSSCMPQIAIQSITGFCNMVLPVFSNISANFNMCSNLEHATHHSPLQCHRFVLYGLAYLLRTWRNVNYIQSTHTQSIIMLELHHKSALSHTFPLPHVST